MKYVFIAGVFVLSIGVLIWFFPQDKQPLTNTDQITEILVVAVGNYHTDTFALKNNLQKMFPSVTVSISETNVTFPTEAYTPERDQYNAEQILSKIHQSFPDRPTSQLIIALTNVNIYSGRLNFVFSSSHRTNKVAIVSSYYLDSEIFTPSVVDEDFQIHLHVSEIINDRILKTTLRVMGSMVGLNSNLRNRPECVMNFSNSLAELDAKKIAWCNDDEDRLRAIGLIY